MRFVYLEAGSGAKSNIRPEMVAAVRKIFKGFLIVGGGIRSPKTAEEMSRAGADAIVIGTFIEKGGSFKTISDIVKTIQSIRK
jgi:phosphoglycerol geranylgeranyltransferase